MSKITVHKVSIFKLIITIIITGIYSILHVGATYNYTDYTINVTLNKWVFSSRPKAFLVLTHLTEEDHCGLNSCCVHLVYFCQNDVHVMSFTPCKCTDMCLFVLFSCDDDHMYVGDKCFNSAYVIAVFCGTAGLIIVILLVVIIVMCCRRGSSDADYESTLWVQLLHCLYLFSDCVQLLIIL